MNFSHEVNKYILFNIMIFLISERAVTPNDSTDEDESSDDEDEVNEISFEFRENPGWLAFSDSD